MLRKRLIGVVTVRKGWAVQSFGYRRYLPLGRPECLVENLDRWGADEILVQVIDRSSRNLGPDFDLLMRLGKLGLETPLIYGGGITSADHAVQVIQSGADRISIDQILHNSPCEVRRMALRLGAQALIAAVPIRFCDTTWLRHDYMKRQCFPFDDELPALFQDRVVSELMLIDWQNEGNITEFKPEQLARLPFTEVPVIMFGGFTKPSLTRRFLDHPKVAAVAVGNLFSYREHAYQDYKRVVGSVSLRPPTYYG